MKINTIRGTKDLFGNELKLFNFIKNTAAKLAECYIFQEIRTPIIEYTDVFIRNLGEASDIVNKEIYNFTDKSGDSICLRPEFTAGVVRAFTNNLQHLPLPLKLYSSGSLFRYERPQKGRYRQFHQVNFEIIGAKNYQSDVELILLANTFLEKLGLKNQFILEINSLGCEESRNNYRAALVEYLQDYKSELSQNSLSRLEKNPLRILDSKDQNDQDIIKGAPKINQFYTDTSKEFFEQICKSLKDLNIQFKINDKLVRGIDYYSHVVFEFKSENLGAQDTILAGGRYESLVSNLGGKNLPAVGFAAGIERLMEIVQLPEEKNDKIISIIPIGASAEGKAVQLVYHLRENNFKIDIHYDVSLKSRMKKAEKSFATIIFGDDELKMNKIKVKFMQSGNEETISINSTHELIKYINSIFRP